MLISYLRSLSGKERSTAANFHLALFLAFIAGAINASSFFAVQRYTAHMTGIITIVADGLVLGKNELAISGLCALLAFVAGATCSSFLIYRSGQRHLHSEFAFPFMIEAVLLLLFGLFGDSLQAYQMFFVPITITVLCFVMGLQNATITKMSNSQIRTTHVTGLVTDLGIELGKLFYTKFSKHTGTDLVVPITSTRLWILTSLLLMFFAGGMIGILSFIWIGFTSILPLGILLAVIAAMPMLEDLGLLRYLSK